ncbi:MAG: NAD-dependent epimerase/dehydratase family protein [Chlorobi bacterium]|nr:NAD-dependent epimerase/dehydratase family protein [Chlorobiota bacterium]MCI0714921.1 NAD-dependent epimerase/dehydratase family protein [Chlorobiota bacterium]
MKKSCIIYGGAGFIGSHIADDLLARNFKVTVFDKLNASRKNVEHILDKIDFIEGDFNNKVDINKSSKKADYVVHLVSSTLPANSNLNPFYDVESNLLSTLNLLESCVKNNIKKVIFISSGGTVYGNPLKLPIKEDHPTNPMSSYGIIKLSIEKYLGLYRNLKRLNYKILRFSNPFGERQNPKLRQGLITHLLYRIKNKMPIEIWGDGKTIRDYFYIKDGAKSVYKSIIDNSQNYIYNISSSKGLSINQILEKFRRILKLNFKVKYLESRRFDVSVNILDNRLAAKYLGWETETDFSTALKNTWRYILDYE